MLELQTKEAKTQDQQTADLNHAAQLESQLKMAGAVQRDFLPSRLPNSDKISFSTVYLPADYVSGDIYDITRLDENHIGFYLADAVGHSIPAALLTIFIKQAIQMRETIGNTYRIFSPLEVIQNLNSRMCEQHLSGCQFATCCYCLLNTDTMELTYCRAGHPYPLLVGKDGTIKQLETRGALLGVFETAAFDQDIIQLTPGDKILIYSDGADPLVEKEFKGDEYKFECADDFTQLLTNNAKELAIKFELLAESKKPTIEEVDDISLVSLEILQNKNFLPT